MTSLILGVFTNSVPEVCKYAKDFKMFASAYVTMFYRFFVTIFVSFSDCFSSKALLFEPYKYDFGAQ